MDSDFISLEDAKYIIEERLNKTLRISDFARFFLESKIELHIKALRNIEALKVSIYTESEANQLINTFIEYKTIYSNLMKDSAQDRTVYAKASLAMLADHIGTINIKKPDQESCLEAVKTIENIKNIVNKYKPFAIDGFLLSEYFCYVKASDGLEEKYFLYPEERQSIFDMVELKYEITNEDINEYTKNGKLFFDKGTYKLCDIPALSEPLIDYILRNDHCNFDELISLLIGGGGERPFITLQINGDLCVIKKIDMKTTIIGTTKASLNTLISELSPQKFQLDPREMKTLGQLMNVLVQLSGIDLSEPYIATRILREDAAKLDLSLPESDETLLKWLTIGMKKDNKSHKPTRKK